MRKRFWNYKGFSEEGFIHLVRKVGQKEFKPIPTGK